MYCFIVYYIIIKNSFYQKILMNYILSFNKYILILFFKKKKKTNICILTYK